MTPERWQEVERLYHAALERSAAERAAYLGEACGGDSELRAEVESLLATHAGSGEFLEAPAIEIEARAIAHQAPRLVAGQRLGPFLVSEPLGAGGMGEVWRARDTALGRDVAIKVLSATYSGDAERLRRFEQEARAAGQINHPNILTVYAVGRHAGTPYQVTELLEGETLDERLQSGALPARKAADLAIQIAHGLAAAHERGIVHRDLKPANLFVTKDGRLKILDFGLAKLTEAGAGGGGEARSTTGAVLGTAGYMAPEQVRGQAVDHRADLFSLGVVLYEMLSGRRAFSADSAVETMNQILTADPPPLDDVDAGLARVVHHCLEKAPGERFQSARDLAFHLEGARPSSDVRTPIGIGRSGRAVGGRLRRWLPWTLAAIAGLAAVSVLIREGRHGGPSPRDGALRRFSLSMQATPLQVDEWPPLAISPDGRRLAYVVRNDKGPRIVVRDLDALSARAVPGTDNGFAPFFSPDGEHLGFFTSDSLMRVALVGGPPARLTSTPPVSRGAVWADDGRIYFAPSQSDRIFRISADGGVAEPVTQDEALESAEGHVWPDVSPDGAFLVYVARRGDSFDEARIVARSLRTGQQRTIVEGGTYARVAPDGRILFARGATVYSVEFDPVALAPRGLAQPMLDRVQMSPLFGGSCYGIARDGTLVYAPGDARPPGRTLLWATPSGTESAAFPEERPFLYPAISPDGAAVAVTIEGVHQDLWRFDIGRQVLARLTSRATEDFGAVWSPDGRRLAYTSVRQGEDPATFVKPSDSLDGDSRVAESSFPNTWTGDGDAIVVTTQRAEGERLRNDLSVAPLAGGGPRALGASRYDRYGAALGPDGRHLAFVSIETGRAEVFVAAADASDPRQASVGGGTSPVWSRDGRALFYRSGDAVMSVAVGAGPRPSLALPRRLFRGRFEEPARPDWPRNYDVAPDGRFLMVRQTYTPTLPELVVVLGWRGQTLLSSSE